MSSAQEFLNRLNFSIPDPPSEDEEDEADNLISHSPGSLHSILLEDEQKSCNFVSHRYPLKGDETAIFSWGMGHKYQLGFGESESQVSPSLSEPLTRLKLVSISCSSGGSHAFGITSKGRAYVWGTGKLGLGEKKQFSPSPHLLVPLKSVQVKQIACSRDHALALTTSRQVFGWGTQVLTGLQHDTEEPEPLEFLTDKLISRLECSDVLSIALPVSGKSCIWGHPGPWLGLGEEVSASTPGICNFGLLHIAEEPDYFITAASVSTEHVAVVTNSGHVYTCGVGDFGKLGHNDEVTHHTLKRIDTLSGEKVLNVSLGSLHTGVLTTKGKIYTCGQGWYYQLGHGNQHHSFVPQLVTSVSNEVFCKIHCSEARTFAISDSGAMVVWGFDPVTQMAYAIPRIQDSLTRNRVHSIVTGQGFAITITAASNRLVQKPLVNKPDSFVPPVDESQETGPRGRSSSAPAKDSLRNTKSRSSLTASADLRRLLNRRRGSSQTKTKAQAQQQQEEEDNQKSKYYPSTYKDGKVRYDFSEEASNVSAEPIPPVRVYSWQMENVEFAKPRSLEVKKILTPKGKHRVPEKFPDPPQHLPPPPEEDTAENTPQYKPRGIKSPLKVRRISNPNRLKIKMEGGGVIGFVITNPDQTTLRAVRRQISEELDDPPPRYSFVFNGAPIDFHLEKEALAKPFLPIIEIREF